MELEGTPLWLLLQIAPIKNERDVVVLFLCTFRDITALKQPLETEETKGTANYSRSNLCISYFCFVLFIQNGFILNLTGHETSCDDPARLSASQLIGFN